jgi:drug/metabolite transporter (DMT)-like permease
MLIIVLYSIIFSIAGTATIVLLGNRNFLDGNLLNFQKFIAVIFHWRFILAVICAFVARYIFMLINGQLLKIPSLSRNSTTITGFITSVATIFMMIANYYFLGERISYQQLAGGILIMSGIWLALS